MGLIDADSCLWNGLAMRSCCVALELWSLTMEHKSVRKKNDIMPSAATWTELETHILGEISQNEKDKYHMISLISGNKHIAQKTFPQKRNSWTW